MSTNINFDKKLGITGGAGITLPTSSTPSFQNLNSFSFDGIDDYFLGTSTYSEIDGLGNFAFSFWIKPSALSGYRQILTIGTAAADYRNQQIQILIDSGKILVYVSSTSYYWRSTTILTQDVWQHILVTRDSARPINQKGKVYINGVDSSSADNTRYWTNNATSNSGLMIGRHNNGWASLFSGKIDEVAVYTQDMASYVSEIYGGGEAVDLNNLATAPQPTTWQRMGEDATWNGATWTMTDVNGSYTNRSINMVEANRTTDVPPNPFANTLSTLFDGIDDRVEINRTLGSGYAELSVSTWVKYNNNLATSNRYHPIVAKIGPSFGNSFVLQNMRSGFSSNGGELYFNVQTPNGSFNAFSGVVPSQNVWYNIVGTYDGSNVKIYIDGVLKATTSASGNINSNNEMMILGDAGHGGFSAFLNGNLDEVSIYSRGLTQSEVTSIYNSGTPNSVSSISDIDAWWRMGDGDTANTITDNVGSNNGTMVNMSSSNFVTDVPLFNTRSIALDGVDDFVEISNATSFNDTADFSVSAWLKFTSSASTKNALNIRDDRYLYISGGKILGAYKNASAQFRSIQTSLTYNDGNWHHVLFVKNSTNMILFVDGTQVAINLNGGATRSGGTIYARIGSRAFTSTPSNFFEGSIDEMAYFTSDQSTNVTTIYNGGVPNDISSLSPLSWWRCGDGDTAPTLTDNGSGGNNGTMTNFSAFSTDVPFNYKSIALDGVDDYVSFSQITYAGEFTTSFWIKPGSLGVSFLAGREANSDYVWLRTTSQIRIRINFSTYSFIESGGNDINTGNWNHLLISRDSSNNVRLFLNGASFSTSQVGAGDHRLDQIGKVGTSYYDGNVDETAFWDSDQSSNLATIYNSGVPNDISSLSPTLWYRMGDGDTSPTLTDNGSSNNNGTMNNFSAFSTDVPT